MSVYEDGVNDMGDVPFLPQGSFSESPSIVKDDAKTLDAEMNLLWSDVKASKLTAKQKLTIQSFINEWKNFYKKNVTYVDRTLFVKSTVRRIEKYRERMLELRKLLGDKYKLGLSPLATRADESPTAFKPPGVNWKKVLMIAGGVTVVVGGGLYLYGRHKKNQILKIASVATGGKLEPPPEMIHNPPPWVKDPDIWESAKLAVSPYKKRYDNPDAVITHVYKQMGGVVG